MALDELNKASANINILEVKLDVSLFYANNINIEFCGPFGPLVKS